MISIVKSALIVSSIAFTATPAQADELSDALRNMQQASQASHSSCRTFDQNDRCINLHINNITAHYNFMAAVERELQEKAPKALRGKLRRELKKMHGACDTLNDPSGRIARIFNGLDCEKPMMKAGKLLIPMAIKHGILAQ